MFQRRFVSIMAIVTMLVLLFGCPVMAAGTEMLTIKVSDDLTKEAIMAPEFSLGAINR